jgi:hypothetical protein
MKDVTNIAQLLLVLLVGSISAGCLFAVLGWGAKKVYHIVRYPTHQEVIADMLACKEAGFEARPVQGFFMPLKISSVTCYSKDL